MSSRRTRHPIRIILISLGSIMALIVVFIVVAANVGPLITQNKSADPVTTAGMLDFATPLAIPPLADSQVDSDGTRVFALEPQRGTSEFHPGVSTASAGFDGAYLGPTIVAQRGEDVRIDVTNSLSEPTSVHWHGMHLPPAMDGGPHQLVQPGETWSPSWQVDQPAATLWYHPHPHGETEEQVRSGLAGLFYIEDESSASLDLPREYGVDDVPVVVQDVEFGDDGEFKHSNEGYVGVLGDELLVNGTIAPYLEVTTERVRLRLVNASSARVYNFALDDEREVELIGIDGGLLESPYVTDGVRLSPGERAEIVVTMTPGEQVVLRSTPPFLGAAVSNASGNGGTDRLDVLELRAASALAASPAVPAALVDIPRLEEADAATTRTLELNGFAINGRSMDMSRIDETVTVDTTEVWTVRNTMVVPHNFHVHDVQFQVLSVDGSAPPTELSGWKDTIYLEPQVEYRLALHFTDFTDPNVPYMYHCHLLWHEDSGMMGQFVVVLPGEKAGTPPEMHGVATDERSGYGPRDVRRAEIHHR